MQVGDGQPVDPAVPGDQRDRPSVPDRGVGPQVGVAVGVPFVDPGGRGVDAPVQVAGDYMALPSQESAVVAGTRAAARVLAA